MILYTSVSSDARRRRAGVKGRMCSSDRATLAPFYSREARVGGLVAHGLHVVGGVEPHAPVLASLAPPLLVFVF